MLTSRIILKWKKNSTEPAVITIYNSILKWSFINFISLGIAAGVAFYFTARRQRFTEAGPHFLLVLYVSLCPAIGVLAKVMEFVNIRKLTFQTSTSGFQSTKSSAPLMLLDQIKMDKINNMGSKSDRGNKESKKITDYTKTVMMPK